MDRLPAAGVGAHLRARFRLHDNWRALAFRAWSVRFALAAATFDGLAMAAGFFTDAPEAVRPWIAGVGFAATILAALARLMPQRDLTPTAAQPEDAR